MKFIFALVFSLFSLFIFSQKKYLVKMNNSNDLPSFVVVNGTQVYNGDDKKEDTFFNQYTNFNIYRACPSSHRENVLKFIFVDTDDVNFIDELLDEFPEKYIKYEDVTNSWEPELMSDMSVNENYEINNFETPFTPNQILANNYPNVTPYYPNDYTTVTVQAPTDYNTYDLNDFKYVNAPIGWGINPGGSSNINIGVSDGKIMATDTELSGKVSFVPSGDPFSGLAYNPCNLVTTHGTGTAIAIAAKGNNNHGVVGVCYNCEITGSNYNFNAIIELAQTGVHVINMSWAYLSSLDPEDYIQTNLGELGNNAIQEIVEDYGTILVASAGNSQNFDNSVSFDNAPLIPRWGYPASFDNVISVSSVHHWYDLNNHPNTPWTTCYQNQEVLTLVEDSIGFAVRVDSNPAGPITYACDNGGPGNAPTQGGGHVFNEQVDILAPTHNHLVYGRLQYGFCPPNTSKYGGGTSHSAPMVSGTIGLMLSEDECLTIDEVEDILKLSSKTVENLSFNTPYLGLSGAGALQVGNAVAFVHEMNKIDGTVILKNQTFNRYNLSAKRIQNNLVLEDIEFIGNSVAEFKSGSEINLLEGTLLEPGSNDVHVLLEVGQINTDPCNNTQRMSNLNKDKKKEEINIISEIEVFPTLVLDDLTIKNNSESKENEISSIEIYDFFGVKVYEESKLNSNRATLKLSNLKSGIYVVKIYDNMHNVIHTEKIIKK